MLRIFSVITFLCSVLVFPLGPPAASAEATSPPLVLIFDASGSMWGQIDGENKIVIARRVLADLVDQLPDPSEVGLIAYGHRREGDCEDIETVVPVGVLERGSLKQAVTALNPKGKTPITRSLQQAFDQLQDRAAGATVILVSDGLETCGGDPCAAVRAAKEQGVEFILHVVGFDVAGEDVSQLECAAQAGGGMFLSAENAAELGSALEAAVAMPADEVAGRLVVKAVAGGALQDVAVTVSRADSGEQVVVSRTYDRPETNPRAIPLPDGRFEVRAKALGLKGDIERRFEIEIIDGGVVEKEVDFSTGEISVGVTRNGELSDAVYRVYVAGTSKSVAQGRTYNRPGSNPGVIPITAGHYDVQIRSVEIAGRPEHPFGRIEVTPAGRVELAHDYQSGILRVGAVHGEDLVDVTLGVVNLKTNKEVGRGRTYTAEKTNPKTLVVEPGRYRVSVKAIGLDGKPSQQFEVTVQARQTVEQIFDFGS